MQDVFQFAYRMTFGRSGEHRDHRSGGTEHRKPGKIFIQTFQGKLAEYGACRELRAIGLNPPEPDLDTWELGTWDSGDLIVGGKDVSVKSTKHFGNLLLLETKDWNDEGQYIPNLGEQGSSPDIVVLVRLSPDGEKLMASRRWLYSMSIDENELRRVILDQRWLYDCPGFITHRELVGAIRSRQILPQGAFLNGRTKMDAENYYIQTGDFYPLNQMQDIFR